MLRPLIVGAVQVVVSTSALAGPAESLCDLVDGGMRASLQLVSIEAAHGVQAREVPGAGEVNTLTCTWASKTQDRVLTVTTAGATFPGDMPVSCSEQKGPDQSMVMCMASSGGPLITAVLMQKSQNTDPKLLPTLRAHTETLASKWGKLTQKR